MGLKSVVLDFDGTVTDVDKESVPVIEGWKEDVGKEMKFTNKEIQKRWNNTEIKIRNNPKNYGWIRGERLLHQHVLILFLWQQLLRKFYLMKKKST